MLPNRRALLRLPVPLLPALGRPMRLVRPARTQRPEANHLGGLRLPRSLFVTRSLRITTQLLGLGLPLESLEQQELPPLPMKRLVFGDGLLLMAFPHAGAFRIRRLGCLPLLFPGEVDNPDAPVPAISPLRGP